jgi:hypothetical protein
MATLLMYLEALSADIGEDLVFEQRQSGSGNSELHVSMMMYLSVEAGRGVALPFPY